MGIDKDEIAGTVLELEKSSTSGGVPATTAATDGNGDEQQSRAWNATEAYRLIDGEWRIVHSHWAFAQTAEGATAS